MGSGGRAPLQPKQRVPSGEIVPSRQASQPCGGSCGAVQTSGSAGRDRSKLHWTALNCSKRNRAKCNRAKPTALHCSNCPSRAAAVSAHRLRGVRLLARRAGLAAHAVSGAHPGAARHAGRALCGGFGAQAVRAQAKQGLGLGKIRTALSYRQTALF